MDALRSCVNLRQVRRILEEFPSQIEGAYAQTWNRILDEDEENLTAESFARDVLIEIMRNSVDSLKEAQGLDAKVEVSSPLVFIL